MRKIHWVALLVLLALSLPGMAQERKGGFEITPFIGDFSQVAGAKLDGGSLWGFNMGYMAGDKFSLEVNWSKLVAPGEDGDIYALRGLWHFRPEQKLVPFVMVGAGQVSLYEADDLLFEAGAGFKYSFSNLVGLRADVREVFADNDFFKQSVAYSLGLTLQFGGAERPPVVIALTPDVDGDGVRESIDYCWNTPPSSPTWKMVVDERGCPLDENGNGVPDYKDDGDADGVINYNDLCPATLKGYPVKADGCDKDTDGDGLVDGKEMELGTDIAKVDTDGDKCGDFDEVMKYKTNPVAVDTDNDGLGDCDEIMTYKTDPLKFDTDGDGFKDGEEVLTYKSDPTVAGDVYLHLFGEKAIFFNLNQASIRKDAEPVLDETADFMAKYAAAKLHIAGNTCDLGPASWNMKLSLKRAEAAKAYLVKKGVAADRISTEGLGETAPKFDNKTNEGRKQNRRDDLTIK
jgi:OOP family OmpA-OmpF porin